jgi:hypothetical protein
MMMRALQAGGMDIAFHPELEDVLEVSMAEQFSVNFPNQEQYVDRVVKIMPPPWGGLLKMPPGKYKIVWLHRDSDQRWMSWAKLQEGCADITTVTELARELKHHKMGKDYHDARAAETLEIMRQRRDVVGIAEFGYDWVIENPLKTFTGLREQGWPVDPNEAATVPVPQQKVA